MAAELPPERRRQLVVMLRSWVPSLALLDGRVLPEGSWGGGEEEEEKEREGEGGWTGSEGPPSTLPFHSSSFSSSPSLPVHSLPPSYPLGALQLSNYCDPHRVPLGYGFVMGLSPCSRPLCSGVHPALLCPRVRDDRLPEMLHDKETRFRCFARSSTATFASLPGASPPEPGSPLGPPSATTRSTTARSRAHAQRQVPSQSTGGMPSEASARSEFQTTPLSGPAGWEGRDDEASSPPLLRTPSLGDVPPPMPAEAAVVASSWCAKQQPPSVQVLCSERGGVGEGEQGCEGER